MKKLFAIFLIFTILSVTVTAVVPGQSFLCTVNEADLSGKNYQIYFSNCRGHYENDAVTIYVTNTTDREIDFQVTIGFSGSKENPTTVESGYVTLQPYVTGKFVLDNLFNVPERANDELGYIPNSHLSADSVVRVQARGIEPGDTFLVCGFSRYGYARDTGFSSLEPNAIKTVPTTYGYINDAKLVIKKEVEEKEVTEITLEQPDTETVNKFITFTVASAIVCAGGLIIYTVTFIIKRRQKND